MTYHWGKEGHQSEVALLASKNNPSIQIDPDEHYADLWMGSHHKASSTLLNANGTNESKTLHELGVELPYLLNHCVSK